MSAHKEQYQACSWGQKQVSYPRQRGLVTSFPQNPAEDWASDQRQNQTRPSRIDRLNFHAVLVPHFHDYEELLGGRMVNCLVLFILLFFFLPLASLQVPPGSGATTRAAATWARYLASASAAAFEDALLSFTAGPPCEIARRFIAFTIITK
jgi:hypothetical protein